MISLILASLYRWTWRLVSVPSGYIWLTDQQTVFKYLTHKKINIFLFCSLKCWMCIKMRKIIFRIDMTFLVHKSKEITSRRGYYFFAPIQEITIFPSMFIFWYLISPFLFSLFISHVVVFFSSLVLSATNWAWKCRKQQCDAAVELVQMSSVSEVVWRAA